MMKYRKCIIINFIIAILCLSPLVAEDLEIKRKFHHREYYDIFVIKDGKEKNLTNYNKWTNI